MGDQIQAKESGDIEDFKRNAQNANLDYKDNQKRNMLMFAALNYKFEIFEYLLEHTELVFEEDSQHSNIMHYIALSERDDPMMAHRVVQYASYRKAKDMLYQRSNGKTPFIHAETYQNDKIYDKMKDIKGWRHYRYQYLGHKKYNYNKNMQSNKSYKRRQNPPKSPLPSNNKTRQDPPMAPKRRRRLSPPPMQPLPQQQNEFDRSSMNGESEEGSPNVPLTPESSSYSSATPFDHASIGLNDGNIEDEENNSEVSFGEGNIAKSSIDFQDMKLC